MFFRHILIILWTRFYFLAQYNISDSFYSFLAPPRVRGPSSFSGEWCLETTCSPSHCILQGNTHTHRYTFTHTYVYLYIENGKFPVMCSTCSLIYRFIVFIKYFGHYFFQYFSAFTPPFLGDYQFLLDHSIFSHRSLTFH